MKWNRAQDPSDSGDGNGNDINQCKWLCLGLQANIQGRQLFHIKILLGRANGLTVQREWGRQKFYTMLGEKVTDEDLLGNKGLDVEVGIIEMNSREMWCEGRRWADVAQDCGQ